VLARLSLAALMAVSAAVVLHEGRALTFWGDEWNFILTRRGDGVDDLLDAHVQHFSLVPVVIYRAMFAVFGIDDYAPYRVATVALHLLCAGLLFALVRRWIGDWAALAAVVPVLFLGRAHEDLIWAFQMGFLAAIASGLGALLALRRRTAGADAFAALLLCVSLASSGTGVPFFAAAAVEVMLRPSERRPWVVLVPLVLYGLWYAGYGESAVEVANLPDTPVFAATMIATAAAALVGLGVDFGRMAALLGAFGVGRAVAGSRAVRDRVLPPLAGLLLFAVATGLARADNEAPGASRYLYPAAVLVVLVAAAALAGRRAGPAALAVAAAVAALAAVGNLTPLYDAADHRRVQADELRADLAGLELARDTVPPGFTLDSGRIESRAYLQAVDDWGSPAYTEAELAGRPEHIRARADSTAFAALPLAFRPAGPAARRPACSRVVATGAAARAEVPLAGGGAVVVPAVGEPVELRVRMFARQFPIAPAHTATGPTRVALPPGRPRPEARLSASSRGPFEICG
jgi:hypothetical protein